MLPTREFPSRSQIWTENFRLRETTPIKAFDNEVRLVRSLSIERQKIYKSDDVRQRITRKYMRSEEDLIYSSHELWIRDEEDFDPGLDTILGVNMELKKYNFMSKQVSRYAMMMEVEGSGEFINTEGCAEGRGSECM
jgi:hypothetical protein